MSKLSKNLKKLRSKMGLTQENISAMIGIKRPTYSSYEEYRAEPNIKTIIALSVLFGVTIDDLLTKEL
jgi:DNA-binding XRE family transcriptional regulator